MATALEGRKIIFVLGHLQLGGAERQALKLACHLAHNEHVRVEVWGCTGRPGQASTLCEQSDLPWRLLDVPWPGNRRSRLKEIVRMARLLHHAHPDVVLPSTTLPNILCGLTWRLSGAKTCVWGQRESSVLDNRAGRLQSLAAQLTSRFMTNSAGGAALLQQVFHVQPEKIRIVHNGIDLPPLADNRPVVRQRLGIPAESFVGCMVAAIHRYKDQETLLKAWRIVVTALQQKGRSAVLLLAGRLCDTTIPLKALTFDLELSNHVRFLNEVHDVNALLAAVDLCTFSSRSEGCPNAVLEAMALGLPVVGTDESGIREAVGPQGGPYLAPAGDSTALAARILRFAQDLQLRAAVGAGNRQRIETEFANDRMCSRATEFLSDCLGQSSRR